MKIVDAFWEKRNLGVDTVEFTVEEKDSTDNIIELIKNNEKIYNVVKIPSTMGALNFIMHDLGYTYVEGSCNLVHNLNPVNFTPLQKRLSDSVDYQKMNYNDYDKLFSEIGKGMFRTDRIAIDPHFGIETANRRYINWLMDELDRGTEIYKFVYKEKDIGFFAFKEINDGVYYPFLSGIYESFSRSGLGFAICTKPIEEAVKRNGKEISTYASTNNRTAFLQALVFGYLPYNINSVFVKYVR